MLSPQAAEAHYDALGADQDRELRYAGPVFDRIVAQMPDTGMIVEFGCGTGVLAARILQAHPSVHYAGFDISATMAGLAQQRLQGFAGQATVAKQDATRGTALSDGCADLVIATYLFDLLDALQTRQVLTEARRLLSPGGRLLVATMAPGGGPVQAVRSLFWTGVQRVAPARVGGCRPVRLSGRLRQAGFAVSRSEHFQAAGIRSELLDACLSD